MNFNASFVSIAALVCAVIALVLVIAE